MEVVFQASREEIARAKAVGDRRQSFNEEKGTKDAHGFEGDGFWINFIGCLAELIVSIYLKLHWVEFAEDYKRLPADVGGKADGVQVRSTEHYKDNGRLITHPKDPDDMPFVLVRIWVSNQLCLSYSEVKVKICGWAYGRDTKKPEYWKEDVREPCFMYPNEKLRPMSELIAILAASDGRAKLAELSQPGSDGDGLAATV